MEHLTKDEIVIERMALEYEDAEAVLDELVHDEKSAEASAINNDGVQAQIEYLHGRGHGLKDLAGRFEGWSGL